MEEHPAKRLLRRPRQPKSEKPHESKGQLPPIDGERYDGSGLKLKSRLHKSATLYSQSNESRIPRGMEDISRTFPRPYKPTGPDGLPCGKVVKRREMFIEYEDYIGDMKYIKRPAFSLEDFFLKAESAVYSKSDLERAVVSRENYEKLIRLFTESFTPKSEFLHVVNLSLDNVPEFQKRRPKQQILVEMALTIKEKMKRLLNNEHITTSIRRMPKWRPGVTKNETNMEILVFEESKNQSGSVLKVIDYGDVAWSDDTPLHTDTSSSHYSGNLNNDPTLITISELAVLSSLLDGGEAISFKAHFVSSLPDLTPLWPTVRYINMSYNEFEDVPIEVFELTQLEILKLHNNPLRQIPEEIQSLSQLTTLVLSHCLLSALPTALFSITNLVFIDASYNKLKFLPSEIQNLKKLKELNLEGNQLLGLPANALRLKLEKLDVRNNYMHPAFWSEIQNTPQRLLDLCCLAVRKAKAEEAIPPQSFTAETAVLLQTYSVCDCCGDYLYGHGLRILRPCKRIFGVKWLPFIFKCCSPQCRDRFMIS